MKQQVATVFSLNKLSPLVVVRGGTDGQTKEQAAELKDREAAVGQREAEIENYELLEMRERGATEFQATLNERDLQQKAEAIWRKQWAYELRTRESRL